MVFYLLSSIVTALFSELSVKVKEKYAILFGIASVLIPSFFAGIRYGIGTDYFVTYSPFFDSLKKGITYNDATRITLEPGYVLINKLVIIMGGSFQWVLFIASLITIIFIRQAVLYYQDKLDVGLAMLIFMLLYYQPSLNIVRQMMAVAITLYSYRYIYEKRPFKFIFFVVLASLFHISALIVLSFYTLFYIFTNKKYRWVELLIYILAFYLVFNFQSLQPLLSSVGIPIRYMEYLRKVSNFTISVGLLLRIVPYIISLGMLWKYVKKSRIVIFNVKLFILGSIIRLIVYMTQFDADRIALYFLIPQVIFIPMLSKNYKRSFLSLIAVIIMILTVVALWYFDYIYMNRNATVPYVSIFN